MQDTLIAYMLAHLTIALPYAIITIGAQPQVFDRRLEEAAQSLGPTPWRGGWHVTLPALRPGLVADRHLRLHHLVRRIHHHLSPVDATGDVPIQIFNSLSFHLEPSVAAISGLMLIVTAALTGILIARGQFLSATAGRPMSAVELENVSKAFGVTRCSGELSRLKYVPANCSRCWDRAAAARQPS